jgi:hypothetical protein
MYSYFSTLSGISPFSVKRLSCVYAKNVWKYLLNSQHCEKKITSPSVFQVTSLKFSLNIKNRLFCLYKHTHSQFSIIRLYIKQLLCYSRMFGCRCVVAKQFGGIIKQWPLIFCGHGWFCVLNYCSLLLWHWYHISTLSGGLLNGK